MAGEAETVAIPKAEYLTLTRIKALMNKGWDSKEDGVAFRKMLKKINPDLTIPDETAEAVVAPIKAEVDATLKTLTERLGKAEKFIEDDGNEKAKSRMLSELDAAKKKFGLDDEGMNKVMERMRDKNNPDVEAAAAYIVSQLPKPKPVADHGLSSVSADLFGTTKQDDDFKELHTGGDPFKPGGWFDQQAAKILNEPAEQAA